ncbi:hypothetical protein [Pseudoroseicyclus sp. CXY001]|uniref:hypothetical protein n=1 Tax=Pseudoroseicyclus sp. CXY001 TaxID=3242492 RepID=UPI003571384C
MTQRVAPKAKGWPGEPPPEPPRPAPERIIGGADHRRNDGHPGFNPSIAFGLKATSLALKAKAGLLRPAEASELVLFARALHPEGHADILAAEAFRDAILSALSASGEALLDALTPEAAASGRRAEDVLERLPDSWQSRKDCGLD